MLKLRSAPIPNEYAIWPKKTASNFAPTERPLKPLITQEPKNPLYYSQLNKNITSAKTLLLAKKEIRKFCKSLPICKNDNHDYIFHDFIFHDFIFK